MKKIFVFIIVLAFSASTFAGGSIFKSDKKKEKNKNGVDSIGIHICGTLSCPRVNIHGGSCDALPHSSRHYGVCMCDLGYVMVNKQCIADANANCNEIASCSSGYFCNFGGEGSPNRCQKINAKIFEQDGKTYYYNTRDDFSDWCRSSEGKNDCIYGYLTYYGAYDWCSSLGARLLTSEEVSALPSSWLEKLPWDGNMTAYWLDDGRILSNGTVGALGDATGLEGAGGVVCVEDTAKSSVTNSSSDMPQWIDIAGCDCNEEKGIANDSSDDLCNIQCCRNKYGENGYAVNKTCCKKNDDDCICAANGCKTDGNTTPLDDFCCAKAQGLI